MTMMLSVDEDGYLLPSTHRMSSMDLITNGRANGKVITWKYLILVNRFCSLDIQSIPLFDAKRQARICLDNLEYHLMSQEYAVTAVQYENSLQEEPSSVSSVTPTVSSYNHVLPVPAKSTQVIEMVGLSTNDSSVERSSHHDYYNEFQRELQPLHHQRNGTTI